VTAEIYYPAANTDRRVRFTSFTADPTVLTATPATRAAIAGAQVIDYGTTRTASWTAKIDDNGRNVLMNAATALNFTIPPNSSVSFPVGAILTATQWGAGQVTLVPRSGVTLRTATSLLTRAQNSSLSAEQVAVDTWLVTGDGQ